MSKNLMVVVLLLVILVGGYFLMANKQAPSDVGNEPIGSLTPTVTEEANVEAPGENTNALATDTVTPPVEEKVISYTDSGYSPNSLIIKKGDSVVFKNESSKSMWPASAMHPTHTVYDGTSLEEHCPDSDGTAFDACKGYEVGESWSFTFDKVGIWKYHDHIDASNFGTIVVE